ncbi:MAG: hypothetical protein WCJ42_10730 [Actinomycetes bacterium]
MTVKSFLGGLGRRRPQKFGLSQGAWVVALLIGIGLFAGGIRGLFAHPRLAWLTIILFLVAGLALFGLAWLATTVSRRDREP